MPEPLKRNEILVESLYLSVDPAMVSDQNDLASSALPTTIKIQA